MSYLQSLLEIEVIKQAEAQEAAELAPLMAQAGLSKEAFGRLVGCARLGSGDEWLQKYLHTPLFDRAVALEREALQQEMDEEEEERKEEAMEGKWRKRHDARRRLGLAQKKLDLELLVHQQAEHKKHASQIHLPKLAAGFTGMAQAMGRTLAGAPKMPALGGGVPKVPSVKIPSMATPGMGGMSPPKPTPGVGITPPAPAAPKPGGYTGMGQAMAPLPPTTKPPVPAAAAPAAPKPVSGAQPAAPAKPGGSWIDSVSPDIQAKARAADRGMDAQMARYSSKPAAGVAPAPSQAPASTAQPQTPPMQGQQAPVTPGQPKPGPNHVQQNQAAPAQTPAAAPQGQQTPAQPQGFMDQAKATWDGLDPHVRQGLFGAGLGLLGSGGDLQAGLMGGIAGYGQSRLFGGAPGQAQDPNNQQPAPPPSTPAPVKQASFLLPPSIAW